MSISAQRNECSALYSLFTGNRTSDPRFAYEKAKEYLRKCPNNDQYGAYLIKWTAAFETELRKLEAQKEVPVESRPSPLPGVLEQTDPQPSPSIVSGRYYALVIGNDSYRYVSGLKTAVTDARVIEALLRKSYGFDVKLLLNASRQDLFSAISYYRRNLDQNDSLLVYYAGHGYFDREADKAYWLPVDARQDDSANWVSADDITSNIKAVAARHVLIVSDSCYSGAMYRELGIAIPERTGRERFLKKMVAGKSRTLMSSGGNEPVADGGGGGHSVFARAFLTGLTQIERPSFTAGELFQAFIHERVAGGANQTPEYNPLRNSGHENGDFVFIRK